MFWFKFVTFIQQRLKEEARKSTPNKATVAALMDATWYDRRTWILDGAATAEIVERFPILTVPNEVGF